MATPIHNGSKLIERVTSTPIGNSLRVTVSPKRDLGRLERFGKLPRVLKIGSEPITSAAGQLFTHVSLRTIAVKRRDACV
jgi:hypothetical protein